MEGPAVSQSYTTDMEASGLHLCGCGCGCGLPCFWRKERLIDISSIYFLLHCQALYGRTDGLYSRAMLSKGLKDQRVLTERLEKMLIAQTAEMEECREFMDR